MKKNYFLLFAALFGMLAVILGAFGAHGLEKIVDAKMLDRFHTGVEYQFYHSFAIGLVGLLVQRNPNAYYVKAAYAFILGIILFSGSLYLYVFTGITKIAMVTPLGGTAFIIAWGLLAWGIWKTETLNH
ncbi:MAG: DUF423 domain-containing protein [Thiothrix sp.]|nr:MAG: DUF423 domain-containing protein [Thiothrix sp.]